MEKKLKSWQGWLLFGGTMVVVFVLGMIAASVNERHAEVTSVMNNKTTGSVRELHGLFLHC